LFTASIAKRIFGLSTVESKTNFVGEHLRGIGGFEGNDATRHGQDNEATARACYFNAILQEHPGAKIVETGKAYGRYESNSKCVFDMDKGTGVSQLTPWSLHNGGETRICTLILCDSVKTLIATKEHKVGVFGIGEVCRRLYGDDFLDFVTSKLKI